jgi:hypothetical protein
MVEIQVATAADIVIERRTARGWVFDARLTTEASGGGLRLLDRDDVPLRLLHRVPVRVTWP